MTELSELILHNWLTRKKYAQKTAFIEFLKQHLPELKVEEPSGTITDISDYDMEQLMEVFSGIAGSIAQNFN